jgi:hypothetical protein
MVEGTTAVKIGDIKQSKLEGNQGYKYNEDGRRYHGKDDIAYILPNDDDGNLTMRLVIV